MKHIFLLLIISMSSSTLIAQYVSLNNREINSLKKMVKSDSSVAGLYASYKKIADEALTQQPNPIDTLFSEGHLATDPKKIATNESLKDIGKMYILATVYRIGNNPDYLNKLVEFLVAWATVNQPQGNPINDTNFEGLLFAYDLVRVKVPLGARQAINKWLIKIADEEINTGKDKKKITSMSNWNSHRLKIIGCIAYILTDTNSFRYKKYIDEELPVQIEKNLFPDGSGFDFHERDALHYHVYTLDPLICLATVVERATEKDFYNYTSHSGASIKKSVDFLIPFVTGEKTHAEFVNSKIAFDKKRADNKEAGFQIGAEFIPTEGIPVLVRAAYFQPSCMDVVKKVTINNSDYPTWQAVINTVRR